MKKILIPIMGLLLLSACATGASVSKISASKAKEMMDSQAVVIVDVRTEAEYTEGFIPNAILIPNESIEGAPIELPNKNATILVYCRSGNRSAQAAKKLVDLGYTKVYDFGGIIDWPYEIVN